MLTLLVVRGTTVPIHRILAAPAAFPVVRVSVVTLWASVPVTGIPRAVPGISDVLRVLRFELSLPESFEFDAD
jgi:hypothetical protein